MSVEDEFEGYDIIQLPSTETVEGAEVEVPMEPLFELNDEVYLIPKKPSAGMALGYLERQTEVGPDAAIHWMMLEMLGEEGYDALKNHPTLERETLDQIIGKVEKKVLGGMEGKRPSGKSRRRVSRK
jgi:hypothetical protein